MERTAEEELLFNKQRIERGFSDKDLWSFDYYIAKVICNGIEEFKKTTSTAIPSCDFNGHEMTEDEWRQILDDIKDGFCYYVDEESSIDFGDGSVGFFKARDEAVNVRLHKSMDLLKEWFRALWW